MMKSISVVIPSLPRKLSGRAKNLCIIRLPVNEAAEGLRLAQGDKLERT